MLRVIKNLSRNLVVASYNHKEYRIAPKGSIKLDHDGQDEQAADYLLQTYGFLKDITSFYKKKVAIKPIQTAYGVKIKKGVNGY